MDRQNWFLHLDKGGGNYPGQTMGPAPELPGVPLLAPPLGLLDYLYASDDSVIYDCHMGYTHVPGGGPRGGIDSRPIFNKRNVVMSSSTTKIRFFIHG